MDRLKNFYITNTTSRLARPEETPDGWRTADTQPNDITPYLALRSRLSQVWINRWTVLLLLILVRTLLAIADIEDGIFSAKREALSACTSVQNVGSAMASMPHYMAGGVNELTASGVEKAVAGLWSMLLLSVTAVEELVVFFINMLTQTYVCLITLVVAGSLHVALEVIKEVSDFLNKTVAEIGSDIRKGVDGFSSGLDTVSSVFGGKQNLDLGGPLDKLDNLRLPSGLDQGLTKLNNSIPNFAQVNDFTNKALRLPFEEVKELLNKSHGTYKFDRNLMPVPKKEQLSFCSDDGGIAPFFDGLIEIEVTARKVAIAVLVILAVLVCIPMAYREYWRWKAMKTQAEFARREGYDIMDVVYIISRPYTSRLGIKLAGMTKSYRRQTLIRWVVAYATTPAALFVLTLGLAGLFSALCYYIVLQVVVKETPKLVQELGDFTGKVADAMQNASLQWSNGTNRMILDMNSRINRDVFGWVETSTDAMNKTLNVFSDEMTGALKTAFGGTVLYGPVTEVFNCLIGLKIAGIEKGLTWVHDNARVDFPLLPNDTFSLAGAAKKSGNPEAEKMLTSPQKDVTSEITDVLKRLVSKIENKIRTEAIISLCVVGLYLIVVLLGIIRALTLAFGKNGTRPISGMDFRKPIAMDSVPPTRDDEKKSPFVETTRSGDPFRDPIPQPPAAVPPSRPPMTYHTSGAQPAVPASTLRNVSDNTGSNYRGENYTLNRKPMPSFNAYGAGRPVESALERQDAQRLSSHPDVVGRGGR